MEMSSESKFFIFFDVSYKIKLKNFLLVCKFCCLGKVRARVGQISFNFYSNPQHKYIYLEESDFQMKSEQKGNIFAEPVPAVPVP